MDKKSSALVLFSGGQDSTSCLLWAKNRFEHVKALSFNYGQQHSIELEQGAIICEKLGIERTLIDISFMKDICDSALTSQQGNVSVAHNRLKDLPASFVPNRNLILLSLANTYAQKVEIDNIVTGTCETDFSGYPDCRRMFIDNIESSLFAASSKLSISVEYIRHVLTLLNTTYGPIGNKRGKEPRITIDEQKAVLDGINTFFGNVGVYNEAREELVFEGVEHCSMIYNLVKNSNYRHELLRRDDYLAFVEAFHDKLEEANPVKISADENNFFINIHTPLMYLNKAETFQLAEYEGGLDLVIEDSHTCYKGDRSQTHIWGKGCNDCPACDLRRKGYEEFLELNKPSFK